MPRARSTEKRGTAKHPRGQVPSNHPVTWTDDHQARLSIVIDFLTQLGVMAYPDFKTPFVLHADASHEGLGAVLYQEQGEKLRVVGYGSRTLTPVERSNHLHSGKLEFLALKWAFTEKFRDYLFYALSFVVYMDNNPLKYVMSSAKLNATGLRWVAELADYNFTIKYHPGDTNIDAEHLSGLPLDMNAYIGACKEELSPDVLRATSEAVRERRTAGSPG